MELLQIKSNVLSDFLCSQCCPLPRVSAERQERATFSEEKYLTVNLGHVVLEAEQEKKQKKNLENRKRKLTMSFIRDLYYQTAQDSFSCLFSPSSRDE